MKSQRRFAPTGGEFTPESVARFIGIRMRVRIPPPAPVFPRKNAIFFWFSR